MNQTNHTPGQWNTTAKNNNYQSEVVQEETGKTIAVTYTGNDADARLIAAALELLAALQAIADGVVMDQGKPYTHAETVIAYQRLARAAIAKAEGN